jgi:hypothetical protein
MYSQNASLLFALMRTYVIIADGCGKKLAKKQTKMAILPRTNAPISLEDAKEAE